MKIIPKALLLSLLLVLNLFTYERSLAGIVLNDGDRLIWNFNSLYEPSDFSCFCSVSIGARPGIRLDMEFSGDDFGLGDTFKVTYWENSITDVPFFSEIFTGPDSSQLNRTISSRREMFDEWEDDQGIIEIEMIQGSVNLEMMDLVFEEGVFPDSGHHEANLFAAGSGSFQIIPEPSVYAMVCLGLSVILIASKMRKRACSPKDYC